MNKRKESSKENSRVSSQEKVTKVGTAIKGNRQLFDSLLENQITDIDKSISQFPEKVVLADIS